MLALPGGLIAGAGTGYGPAFGLLVFSALSSAYTFILVGRSVEATKSGSFKQVRNDDSLFFSRSLLPFVI